MNFFDFLQNNLGHVSPIIISAVIALAIIFERIRALFFVYPIKNTQAFFEQIGESVLSGETKEALALCESQRQKPLAQVVKAALVRAHLPESMVEHGIVYAVGENTQKINKRTSFLATIANVATLLGLFGTILGLIHSFEAVAHADPQQKSALLSAGIATAMNATMMGLGVAIPCMVAFSFLINRSNQLVAELENSSIKVLEILKQRYYTVTADHFEQENPGSNKGTSSEADEGNVVPLRRSA